jgi:hypothetical protein
MAYVLPAVAGLALAMLAILFAASSHHKRLVPRRPTMSPRLSPDSYLESLRSSGQYRGVRVETRCLAASHLSDKEYPLDDAPRIPVPGCEASACECGYAGLPERRMNRERRSGMERRAARRSGSQDRRSACRRGQNTGLKQA